jgi:hypothetical protein
VAQLEEVHLKACANALEVCSAIGQWFGFYNDRRLYQALHYRTSAAVWTAEVSPVDLPLCLDDATASPTTPQGQQLQNAIYIRGGRGAAFSLRVSSPGLVTRVHRWLLIILKTSSIAIGRLAWQ